MTPESRKTRSRIDADGVKVVEVAGVRRSVWLIALALFLAGGAGLLALRLALRADPPEVAELEAEAIRAAGPVAAAESPQAAPSAVVQPRPHTVRRRQAPLAPPPPASTEAPPAVAPPLPELPDDPSAAGGGIAVFPPLGTDPAKIGILVPEDFELPEGYVRHYQATDDGQPLPAILMFHPDFEFFDANGQRIQLPEDLIVPPEMAPPGLAPDFLELPPPPPEEGGASPDPVP